MFEHAQILNFLTATPNSIPDTLSAILVPPLGFLVDKYGRRASLLLLCSFTMSFVHVILGLTTIYPVGPFIALGMSYSLYGVAIWPSIACVVEAEEAKVRIGKRKRSLSRISVEGGVELNEGKGQDDEEGEESESKNLGTAYGLSTSALNTALTLFPLLAAQVRVWIDWTGLELFFAGIAGLGTILGGVLWVVDWRRGGVMERAEVHVGRARKAGS